MLLNNILCDTFIENFVFNAYIIVIYYENVNINRLVEKYMNGTQHPAPKPSTRPKLKCVQSTTDNAIDLTNTKLPRLAQYRQKCQDTAPTKFSAISEFHYLIGFWSFSSFPFWAVRV